MDNILLYKGLPEKYEDIPLSTDFRNMINVEIIMLEDDTLDEREKVLASLYQLYENIPADIHKAINGLRWFYTRGKHDEDDEPALYSRQSIKKPYSFSQDANMIFAAFYATYGINLATTEYLHWWEFSALFENLPETTLMWRVMYWRTVDIAELPKHEKKHVQKMRDIYALKERGKKPMSIEEINQKTKDDVVRRFAEVQKRHEMMQAQNKSQ